MKVFVLQKSSKYAMGSAKSFGKLVYLFEEDENLPPFQPEVTISTIRDKLDRIGFNPNEDAVALTGPMIIVTYFMSVLIFKFGKVKTLLFDAKQSKYRLVTVEI
jgi:hypothetical protein